MSKMRDNEEGKDELSEGAHYVFVHGASHGGWCWYKIRTQLEEAGHTVTCVDLKSAGIDTANPDTLFKFSDYNQPLLSFLSSLPESQKVILVGHSLGGFNITQALFKFTNKIRIAVYLAAAMAKSTDTPLSTNHPTISIFYHPLSEITRSSLDPELFDWSFGLGPDGPPTSAVMKKQYQREKYYNMSPLELEHLSSMVAGIYADDGNLQLESTTQFRKLLSIERCPPINEVIQAGVVPRFVEFLMREDFPQLQFEAAWALTNIASGTSENTKVVIDHGAVPIFVKLLESASDDVREQAVWALGNIAGDSPKCRDFVLENGALLPLMAQLNENAKLSMLRNATWTLSNFCRGKPQPSFDKVKPALPILRGLIHSTDEEVLTDACWALSYLSDGTNDKIQAVIEAGVCPRLVELLMHPSPSVLIPALRTVGNIVTGDDIQTQCIINLQALPCLLNLLNGNFKKSIKKETCWTLSNITAGNKEQIQAVIDAGIIGPLVYVLQNAEFDIKKEAAWAISNATSGGTPAQITYLVSQGCIKPMCDLLVCPDPRIITVCLEGLENILKVGEAEKSMGANGGVNLFAQMIDEAEGLEKIENLQTHDNNDIYEKAVKMLETYWMEEDDETVPSADGQVAPPPGGFNFS